MLNKTLAEKQVSSHMKIVALQIERSMPDQTYCGTLDYQENDQTGTILWTVTATPLKIDVAFVQGSDEYWDDLASKHASYFSDQVILEIARKRGLPSLVTPTFYSA